MLDESTTTIKARVIDMGKLERFIGYRGMIGRVMVDESWKPSKKTRCTSKYTGNLVGIDIYIGYAGRDFDELYVMFKKAVDHYLMLKSRGEGDG